VVPVERLRHHGEPDPARGGDRGILGAHDLAPRHGQTRRRQQLVRHLLVAGDVDREGTRHRRHRRPDPLLVLALAELHERVLVQAHPRDVARDGLVDDRLGRGPELPSLGE